MKALSASLLAVLLAGLPLAASTADSNKTLQNVRGTVTYGADATPKTALAIKASTALNDLDYAATGQNSEALITLPDSSTIEMASNSNVQMQSFDVTDVAHARFLVVGKMRFNVAHPQGAKADYVFQTTTGQIAVRGTVGDIAAAPQSLQVNVYAISNAAAPVQVTLVNGQVFTLVAGQSLAVTLAGAVVTAAAVTAVSQTAFAPFTELGAPANASSMGISAASSSAAGASGASAGAASGASAAGAAGAGAAGTAAAAAGAVAAGAAAATISNSSSKTTPAPTPTQSPTPQPTATPTPQPTATPRPSPSPTSTPVTIVVSHPSPQPIRSIPEMRPGRPGPQPPSTPPPL